jgi:hypothetical protein
MSSERENEKEKLEKRDIELENIVGNLMIAEYQVEKLRGRVTEKTGRYGYGTGKKVSSHMFKHDNRGFKISIKVEELAIHKARANQEIE